MLSNENYISTIQSNSGFKQVKRINKGEEFNEKVFFLFHHKLQILSHNTARIREEREGPIYFKLFSREWNGYSNKLELNC